MKKHNKMNRGIIDFEDVREYDNEDGTKTTVYGGQINVEEGTYLVNAYPQKKHESTQKILKLTLKRKHSGFSENADISEYL